MSVTKRIFSLFLLVLMLLLIQHIISGRIQDNYSGKSASQSCHSTNSTYRYLHMRSVAKFAVKKKAPVQNYLSVIFLTIIPLIVHLKFDFADIFFAIAHIPVYHWQLARCDLSKSPVYRTNDEV